MDDRSNGWDAVAEQFFRTRSAVGVSIVRDWARALPARGRILDIGAGSGAPIAEALLADGFAISAIDASPRMTAAFRHRFPEAEIACEPVEESRFFGRVFDGADAIGLMFLLEAHAQRALVPRVADVLAPGGRFLFTAPFEPCVWNDLLTGRQSVSLGADEYGRIIEAAGLRLLGRRDDEGANTYFEAMKPL